MRYFLRLAYNGRGFHGWQSQPNATSVQSTIEDALSLVLRSDIKIVGAGRTDAGVNASEMYAHFDLPEPIADPTRLLRSLNHLMGSDIALYDVLPVKDTAHARFDALSRTYKYYVSSAKSPFISDFTWRATTELNFKAMNEAAAMLLQVSDFTSFSKLHTDVKTNICKVTEAYWAPVEASDLYTDNSGLMVFTITADRFLRNMVRSVVGTLVLVGRGKLTLSGFQSIIEAKDRQAAGESMPAHPLFLNKVVYPDSIFLRR